MVAHYNSPPARVSHSSHTPYSLNVGALFPSAPTTPLCYLVSPGGSETIIASTGDAIRFCQNNPGWACHDFGDGDFD